MSTTGGVCPVHPLGPVALATLATQWRGVLRVTVVAKTTFAFAVGAEMPLVAPQPVARADVHFDNNSTRSIQVSSDLAPHLKSAEVLFQGHAHAPGGVPVPRMHVRLGLGSDQGIVLDKALVVVGDREAHYAEPVPFAQMRIGYERTAGGPGNTENPIGVGFTGGSPNVLYPDAARASKPAGLGPLAASWPCRASLLGGHAPFAFGGGLVVLPDDVDWTYFQAAPPDQRLAEIPDRAWILLDGLHPEQASLRMRLPQLRVSARLYFADAADKPIELRADRLTIDGSAQLCTLTWRGSFPLSHVAQLAEVVVVAAGVHAPGQALAWPVLPERPRPAKAPLAQWTEAPGSSPSPAPSVVLVPGSRPSARTPTDLGATTTFSPDAAMRAVMPFREARKAPPAGFVTTSLPVYGGEPPRTPAPFPLAAAGFTTPAQELPGAPWAATPAPLVQRPREDLNVTSSDVTSPMFMPSSRTSDLPPVVAEPSSGHPPSSVAPPIVIEPSRPSMVAPPMVAPPMVSPPSSPVSAPPPMVSPPSSPVSAPPPMVSPPSPPVSAPPPAALPSPPLSAPPPASPPVPARSPWREYAPVPVAAPPPPAPPPEPEEELPLYGGFGPED